MNQSELSNVMNILGSTVMGTAANETITGTDGADSLVGYQGNDTINGGAGDDTIRGGAGMDYLTGGAGNDLLYGGKDNDTIRGGIGNDILNGGEGADSLVGGADNDTYYVDNIGDVIVENADQGIDTVISSINYTLGANVENLTLTGSEYGLSGTGNDLDNVIIGTSGYNILDGGKGADTMIGGAGMDFYSVDNVGDVVIENANEGRDLVYSSISYTLGDNVEDLVLEGMDYINGTGNDLDNYIGGNVADNLLIGGAGNDTLSGYYGKDTMIGGTGDDFYRIENKGITDVIIENANEGIDTVISSMSHTLADNVENLILDPASLQDINGTGNSLNNVITGNYGNNIIDGGVGADTMIGGGNNDTYYVDSVGDVVVENANEGTDTVISSINYTLGENIENLTLTGSEYGLSGTGNDLDNVIIGTSSYNILDGGKGADTMIGGDGMDFYSVDNAGDVVIENENEGRDLVYSSISYTLGDNVEDLVLEGMDYINGTGNDLDNYIGGNVADNLLIGGAGNDTLSGYYGRDTLIGGTGNDFYILDDNCGDIIIENAGEGIDTVRSSISYKLTDNVENLILDSSVDINGTGNSLNNVITGSYGNNIIDGGIGADTMIGGRGDDVYYVDNVGDVVIENADSVDMMGRVTNEGIDTVISSIDYTLGANVENLTLAGHTYMGVGNALDNVITGNSSYNFLDGKEGADTMIGGAGMDFYNVDNIGDVVVENADEGIDTVYSSINYTLGANVENLILTDNAYMGEGNDLDNDIAGNRADNFLIGGAGNDILDGSTGNDTLIGGEGNDVYKFCERHIGDEVVGDGIDQIIDTEGNDKIYFYDGVNKNNVAMFMDSNNNLIIDYGTVEGQNIVTVQNQTANAVETLQLGYNEYMTSSDINLLIQNMTAYATANSIEFTCVSDVKNNQDLMTMVASAWHS